MGTVRTVARCTTHVSNPPSPSRFLGPPPQIHPTPGHVMHPNNSIEPVPRRSRGHDRRRASKRFHCELCQKHFGRLEHLQRHQRTHTQERPFACGICPSRFTRSDLLIRHGRLSHNKDAGRTQTLQSNGDVNVDCGSSPRAARDSASPPNAGGFQPRQLPANGSPVAQVMSGQPEQSPLDILSMVTQQENFQNGLANDAAHNTSTAIPAQPVNYNDQPGNVPPPAASVVDPGLLPEPDMSELDYYSFDSFATFLETGPLPSFHFSSLVTTEQPMPFFSPQDYNDVRNDSGAENQANDNVRHDELFEDPDSFSRFGSRLPSLQPEEPHGDRQNFSSHHQYMDMHRHDPYPSRLSDVSNEDRQYLLRAISSFTTVPSGFMLPTRLSLARYVRAYVDGFHEHLPFLHIPSMSVAGCSAELILAVAAVGAQYCFEAEVGLALFHAARAIATERVRRRDARIAAAERGHDHDAMSPTEYTASSPSARGRSNSTSNYTLNGPLGLPSDRDISAATAPAREDLMQSAQALLLLMAMATWAKHKEILREALAIQSILASIVRDDGLRLDPGHEPRATWGEWARFESVLRTKYIVFCFFNLHCIVYDIPPLILNSELSMRLPCNAALFKASSECQWRDALKASNNQPMQFQDSMRQLFSTSGKETTQGHSALGNYVLIHAIIQHIFFVRQSARYRFGSSELTADEVTPLDQAVRNWQSGWKHSPESSLNPLDPNGPVAFNSTALLRLAYIRLNMDTGPGRALGTRDPLQIAHALRDTPAIKRTPKLMRALLHSAHALSIPIKIGIRLVAKTQTFIWSIQHSICSLECALLLGKWLEAISALGPEPDPPITDSEKRILSLVRTVLDETEFRVPTEEPLELAQLAKHLNAGVMRVWAAIFRGAQTWAIVEVIGNSLEIYADMLEAT